MSKKTVLIILIASVAINLATVVTFMYYLSNEHRTEHPIDPQHPDRFPQWHGGRLRKELDLDPQQIEVLKKVNEEIDISVRPIREELRMKRQELMSMVYDQKPDQERIDTLIKEIAGLQATHDARIFSGLMKVRDILTIEQRRQLGILIHGLIGHGGFPGPLREPGMPPPPLDSEGR
ncbi:periplasmic heavy metal sensor [candidate division WOR-3 bacterium]|nr:periplasmic heavy metal sensor [candidate division WOR-3 bacterium]